MSIRCYSFPLALCVVAALSSCGIADGVSKLPKAVEVASENLRDGIRGLDVTGIKGVLHENADLRDKLAKAMFNAEGYAGVELELTVDDQDIYFVPVSAVGTFSVFAAVDTDVPNNVVLRKTYSDDFPSIPTSLEFYQTWCPQYFANCNPAHTAGNIAGALSAYESSVYDAIMKRELARGKEMKEIYMDQSLFEGGTRLLTVEVTPRVLPPDARFHAQLVVETPNKVRRVVRDISWELEREGLQVGVPSTFGVLVRVVAQN